MSYENTDRHGRGQRARDALVQSISIGSKWSQTYANDVVDAYLDLDHGLSFPDWMAGVRRLGLVQVGRAIFHGQDLCDVDTPDQPSTEASPSDDWPGDGWLNGCPDGDCRSEAVGEITLTVDRRPAPPSRLGSILAEVAEHGPDPSTASAATMGAYFDTVRAALTHVGQSHAQVTVDHSRLADLVQDIVHATIRKEVDRLVSIGLRNLEKDLA